MKISNIIKNIIDPYRLSLKDATQISNRLSGFLILAYEKLDEKQKKSTIKKNYFKANIEGKIDALIDPAYRDLTDKERAELIDFTMHLCENYSVHLKKKYNRDNNLVSDAPRFSTSQTSNLNEPMYHRVPTNKVKNSEYEINEKQIIADASRFMKSFD